MPQQKSGQTRVKKCWWAHCNHNGFIQPNEESVKVGNKYYHKDCMVEKQTIQDIIDVFRSRINPNVTPQQVRKEINRLIYEGNQSGQFILFVINYAADHHMRLQYPPGIKYLINNKEIVESYNKKMLPKRELKEFKVEKSAVDRGLVVPSLDTLLNQPGMRDILKLKKR